MPVVYRLLRGDEERALLDLWLAAHPNTDREKWRREWRSLDPALERTFVAVAPEGTLLSSAHYRPIPRWNAGGVAERVGQVSHVATHPDHRRRGHATRLMELILEAMARDGCAWSLLYCSDEARPLYERLGWRAHTTRYWAGVLAADEDDQAYFVRPYDVTGSAAWAGLAVIYEAFNHGRPLAVVRADEWWRGYYALRVTDWIAADGAVVLVAAPRADATMACGYILAHAAAGGCMVAEAGLLPGCEDALPALLGALVARSGAAQARALVHLPSDLAQPGLEPRLARSAMARPIGISASSDAIAAAFATPTAVAWPMDET